MATKQQIAFSRHALVVPAVSPLSNRNFTYITFLLHQHVARFVILLLLKPFAWSSVVSPLSPFQITGRQYKGLHDAAFTF